TWAFRDPSMRIKRRLLVSKRSVSALPDTLLVKRSVVAPDAARDVKVPTSWKQLAIEIACGPLPEINGFSVKPVTHGIQLDRLAVGTPYPALRKGSVIAAIP